MSLSNMMDAKYNCLLAIGSSLDEKEMMAYVIEMFVGCTNSLGGVYISGETQSQKDVVLFGETADVSLLDDDIFIFRGAMRCGYIVLRTKEIEGVSFAEEIFEQLKEKIDLAIEACRNKVELETLKAKLEIQIEDEKKKKIATDNMMINQSRLAIMGEMISMIAHQWRQPITIIGMITNNICMDAHMGMFKSEQLLVDIAAIDKQIHYLSQTIDDFRDFFHPNKMPQKVTFEDIQNELTVIFGKNIKHLDISLVFDAESSISIVIYKNELLQVMLNILNNAKDAFAEREMQDKQIRIGATANDSSITITISDNAGGIASQHLDKIFEPYFSTKHEKNGTGLGLYMSAMIVEKHFNGTISALNSNDGVEFTIVLPISGDEVYDVY